ncbi:YwqJ-related putative deaminase, partial [Streptomyces avermitilis]|uniref:YwqJ-related putative deaminase n=1 Tax=Streptomyces avermitilis TaxID=33903 RepID=UPI003F541F23
EAERLFATTKPVADRADGFADDLEKVSGALSSYATEVRPLAQKLEQLKAEAATFVSSVKDDDDWEYDEDKIDHHNRIRDDVTSTVAAFWAAERTCHNAITRLFGGTQMVAGDGSDRKDQYGFNADDMKSAKLPWGDPVEERHHVWEVGHWVKSFVWDGLIVDGVWGTIKGLGTLVGFGGWDAMGQAWKGLAQLATGLVISSIPGAGALFWTLPDDKLPSWLRDSRTAMKETGKALVAWDEWGKNPGRAAGAVTFNVLTTVFTGGAGGAAAGAGKAGAVAKVLSVAGKAGKVIDPMTYITKGAGAALSKIGDIAKGLKGIGNIEIPKLPDNAITLPEGALKLPDGSVHIPEGAAIPEGAVKLPDGNFKLPDDTPAFPEGTTKLPTEPGVPAQYVDPNGNILDHQGNVVDSVDNAPTDVVDKPSTGHPAAGSDVPHVDSPVKEPVLVGAGSHTVDNAGQTVRLGDSLGNDLGDVGRTGDNVPGGQAGHDLPGGNVGDHLPGGTAGDHLPGGRADDLGTGPSASHEPPTGHTGGHGDGPSGPHDPTSPHHNDPAPNTHADDGAHRAGADDHGQHPSHHGYDGLPSGGHSDDLPHHGEGSGDGPDVPDSGEYDFGNIPEGTPLDPQPGWHGQSADKMRHYRRPALDVSHLTPDEQLAVLSHESKALADEARATPAGEAQSGRHHLESGCAGSLLHDNVITVHSSTTKMHGQKLPHTHKVLEGILKQVEDDAVAAGRTKGFGHGKCAEVSLISDRLHQLDPTGSTIRTVDDAKNLLEGSAMHTRQIGDLFDRKTGELVRSHGDFLAPCNTCKYVLPQLGIHVPS